MEICITFIYHTIIGLVGWLIFPNFLWGLLPLFRGRELNITEKEKLMSDGILHYTTVEASRSIVNDKYIRSSSWLKSYSTQFRKATFFFISEYMPHHAIKYKFTKRNVKFEKIVRVTGITDIQLQNFKIRKFDNSIMYRGGFKTTDENKVDVLEVDCNFSKLAKSKTNRKHELIALIRIIVSYATILTPFIFYLIAMYKQLIILLH